MANSGNSNSSAVLDVVTESKTIPPLYYRDGVRDFDRASLCSGSTAEYNSLVQSPSLESFSTIQDIENLSELNMDENSDLCVRVDSPQKHLETLETYITFKITTKVARIEYADNEYVVRRRYNDFVWLRQKLTECHPFCIVPPLPGKHSLIGQLDRYSKDFILLRMKALNVFVSRIVNHPILSCNDHFKIFLTAKHPDFSLHRRQRTNSECNRIRTLSHSNSTYTALKNRHLEFDKTKTYLGLLAEKVATVEKISSRINKERIEFISELNAYHPIFTTWAASEPHLATVLMSIGSAVERTTSAQNMLVHSYAPVLGGPLRDFLAYIDAAQETLKKRDAHQWAYESSLEELNKRHGEKDKLMAASTSNNHLNPSQEPMTSHQGGGGGGGGFSFWRQPSGDEKLEKLGVCIPQLLKKVESNQDSLECANESLRSDLQHWQLDKQQCLKKILLDFANKQIEYYQSSVNAWEHVANELTNSSSTTAAAGLANQNHH